MKKIFIYITLLWKKFIKLFKKKTMIEEMIEILEKVLNDKTVSNEIKEEIRKKLIAFKNDQQNLGNQLDKILGR